MATNEDISDTTFYGVSANGLGHLFWEQVPKGNRVFEPHYAD